MKDTGFEYIVGVQVEHPYKRMKYRFNLTRRWWYSELRGQITPLRNGPPWLAKLVVV